MAGTSTGMTNTMLWRCALLMLMLTLLSSTPARAADPVYVQYACHLPDGRAAPTDGFVATANGAAVTEDRCAAGGGLTITLPDGEVPIPTDAEWTYRPPPGTSIVRATMHREVRNVSAEGADTKRIYSFLNGRNDLLEYCGLSSSCATQRDLDASDPGEWFTVRLGCNANPCNGPNAGPGTVAVDRVAVTLRDGTSPSFTTQPSGTLFAPEPVNGVRSVVVSATDVGGGVYTAALVVDGVEQVSHVLDTNDGACAKPFARAVPCKGTALGQFDFDTSTLADGEHSVAVVVRDATEVNSVSSPPVSIQVRNAGDISASGTSQGPVSGGLASPTPATGLRLLGRGLRWGVVRQRFGHASTIDGRLVDGEGRPVSDTQLAVLSARDIPGADATQIGETRTDSAGRFRVVIPQGSNRRITLRAPSDSWTIRVQVRAPLRLQPSRTRLRNKQKLMLVAYLLGAMAPAGSADIAFQVRIGEQWRTFATRPIGSDGRARIGHRFRVTYQRLTYRFRAVVVGRRSFPFANSVSPTKSVQVN